MPEKLSHGKAEIARAEAVRIGPSSISYLGVELPRSQNRSDYVPRAEAYADFVTDSFEAELQRDIAESLSASEPCLLEGGTSLGKTTTVKKMCAELGYETHYINLNGNVDVEALMGQYIPNPHKRSAADPEYVFADGPVTRALRSEPGKTKVIILDELNSARPETLIRLHEVIDALERSGTITLSEDASEVVPTDKQSTKIVGLMNPPGRGYVGREPLDPALLRRWNYRKLPGELPKASADTYMDTLFGLQPAAESIKVDMLLTTREAGMLPEELAQIDGIEQILGRYAEFHTAAKKLVAERQLGADQPQKFSYDDREEPRRVRNFIARHYSGDITETMQAALYYYYVGKLESPADRDKLMELLRTVAYVPESSSKRRDIAAGAEPAADPDMQRIIDEEGISGYRDRLRASLETKEFLRQNFLIEQFLEQRSILEAAGLLEHGGIQAIDGLNYAPPSMQEITDEIEANLGMYRTKAEQGFTNLLLVPFGMSLGELAVAYGNQLRDTYARGELTSSDGTTLELNATDPVWIWDGLKGKDESGELVYYPKSFDASHGGLSKAGLMGSGWQVLLVEDGDILADGAGDRVGGREQLEAGKSSRDYLNTIGKDAYANETGFTPEAWLMEALFRLNKDGEVLDDYQGKGKACLLTGSYLPASGYVPDAFWSRDNRQASLNGFGPDFAVGGSGVRSAVRII